MQETKENLKPFLLILFFFLALFIYSKFGPSVPIQILSQEKGQPFVVSADGKSVYSNNEAKIMVGIQENGSSLSEVQDRVNEKSKNLISKLKSLGLTDKDIKTVSYFVSPQQDFSLNPPKVTGFTISTEYELNVKNVDKLNDILSTATGNGANLVGGISFDVDDATKLTETNKAREDAVNKAKQKAQGLAKAAGVTLGKIINVSEGENVGRPVPLTTQSSDLKVGLGGGAPEVQPGTNEVNVIVTLTYEIR